MEVAGDLPPRSLLAARSSTDPDRDERFNQAGPGLSRKRLQPDARWYGAARRSAEAISAWLFDSARHVPTCARQRRTPRQRSTLPSFRSPPGKIRVLRDRRRRLALQPSPAGRLTRKALEHRSHYSVRDGRLATGFELSATGKVCDHVLLRRNLYNPDTQTRHYREVEYGKQGRGGRGGTRASGG